MYTKFHVKPKVVNTILSISHKMWLKVFANAARGAWPQAPGAQQYRATSYAVFESLLYHIQASETHDNNPLWVLKQFV